VNDLHEEKKNSQITTTCTSLLTRLITTMDTWYNVERKKSLPDIFQEEFELLLKLASLGDWVDQLKKAFEYLFCERYKMYMTNERTQTP